MRPVKSTTGVQGAPSAGAPQPVRHVLIVEPEELVRWSLVTYLGKWFEVFSADSRTLADRILEERQIDAVVVSDDLSDRAAEAIAAHARSRNPAARVVRTLTGPPVPEPQDRDTSCLEKPFALSEVASLLGVSEPPPSSDRWEGKRPKRSRGGLP